MRLMKSRGEHTVTVDLEPPTSQRVIMVKVGDVVDMDEIVRPARPGRTSMTLAEALGERKAFTREHDGVAFDDHAGRRVDYDDACVECFGSGVAHPAGALADIKDFQTARALVAEIASLRVAENVTLDPCAACEGSGVAREHAAAVVEQSDKAVAPAVVVEQAAAQPQGE